MSEVSSRVSLAKPVALPARSEVVKLLAKHAHLLEEGASTLATNVSVSSGIPIDVLAMDRSGLFVIVDVFDGKSSSWVAHALHHLRWVERNRAMLSNAYARGIAGGSGMVRVAAVVAKMSEPARDALSYLNDISFSCYRVRCFTTGEERFLTLERSCAPGRSSAPVEAHPKKQDLLQPVELTKAEIADFLGGGTA